MVIDTSAWIEWLLQSPVADRLSQHWPSDSDLIIPTIVQLELAKVFERLGLDDSLNAVLGAMTRGVIVDLDSELALLAASYSTAEKLATADAIVYATAQRAGVPLLTTDAHFEGLRGVVYVPKTL